MCRNFACVLCVAAVVVLGASAVAQAAVMPTNYDQAVYNDHPVIYYPGNEASGSTANDLSGNGYNGTYGSAGNTANVVTLGQSIASLSGCTATMAGQLGTFGSYATVTNGSASGTFMPPLVPQMDVGQGNLSIEFWFSTDAQERAYLFNWNASAQVNSQTPSIYIFYNWTDSDIRIAENNMQNNGTQSILRCDSTGVYPSANTLYDVVATRTSGAWALYINGTQNTLSATINGGYTSGTTNTYITSVVSAANATQYNPSWDSGTLSKNLQFNANSFPPSLTNATSGKSLMGQFAIYNYALTTQQVSNHWNAASLNYIAPVPEPGTLALLAAGLAALLAYAWRKRR